MLPDKLKKCPFCGSKPIIQRHNKTGFFSIGCYNENCEILPETYPHRKLKKVAKVWNDRPKF